VHELKKNGKVFTSKFVGTGRGPCLIKKKRIYRVAVSQRLRNTALSIYCNSCVRLSARVQLENSLTALHETGYDDDDDDDDDGYFHEKLSSHFNINLGVFLTTLYEDLHAFTYARAYGSLF
jgi:hypothetical protein